MVTFPEFHEDYRPLCVKLRKVFMGTKMYLINIFIGISRRRMQASFIKKDHVVLVLSTRSQNYTKIKRMRMRKIAKICKENKENGSAYSGKKWNLYTFQNNFSNKMNCYVGYSQIIHNLLVLVALNCIWFITMMVSYKHSCSTEKINVRLTQAISRGQTSPHAFLPLQWIPIENSCVYAYRRLLNHFQFEN